MPALGLSPGTVLIWAAAETAAFGLVRFVLPRALKASGRPIQQAVLAVVGLLLLPECIYSSRVRRRGGHPHRAAHDYGAAVAFTASWVHDGIRAVSDGTARALVAVPAWVVAMACAGLLVWLSR